jgi:sec-independent protein translocase protein TatA
VVDLGPAEIGIILLILVMVFGATKIGDLGGALGQGIKEFRAAVKDDDDEANPAKATAKASADSSPALEVVEAVKCQSCGSLNPQDARFCSVCGQAISAQAS